MKVFIERHLVFLQNSRYGSIDRGDKVTFGFDPSPKKLVSYDVNTWLDDPQKDIVTLNNQFATLPNGPNYLQQTVLDAQGQQIQMTTANSNYSPITQ